MINNFKEQIILKHLYFNKESRDRYLFGNNIDHVRYSSVSASGRIPAGTAAATTPAGQSGTDKEIIVIKGSSGDPVGALNNFASGQRIDPRTSPISPEVYAALARGEDVQVTLTQLAPERVNLFMPLLASVMQIVGGMNGAAYNEELSSVITGKGGSDTGALGKAADFVSRHGTSYSLNPFGGGEHIDVIAEFQIMNKPTPKADPVEILPPQVPRKIEEKKDADPNVDPITHEKLPMHDFSNGAENRGGIYEPNYQKDVGETAPLSGTQTLTKDGRLESQKTSGTKLPTEKKMGQKIEDAGRIIERRYEILVAMDIDSQTIKNPAFREICKKNGIELSTPPLTAEKLASDKEKVKAYLNDPKINGGKTDEFINDLYSNPETKKTLNTKGYLVDNDEGVQISYIDMTPATMNAKTAKGDITAKGDATREACKDALKIAAAAGLITPEELKAAGNDGTKLLALFDKVERKLSEPPSNYRLVDDNKFGPQHITALQEAIIDRGKYLNGANKAADKIYNGEIDKVTGPERQALVEAYNAANPDKKVPVPASGTDFAKIAADKTGLAKAVEYTDKQINGKDGLVETLKSTGGGIYLEHKQLEQFVGEAAAIHEDSTKLASAIKSRGTSDSAVIDKNIASIDEVASEVKANPGKYTEKTGANMDEDVKTVFNTQLLGSLEAKGITLTPEQKVKALKGEPFLTPEQEKIVGPELTKIAGDFTKMVNNVNEAKKAVTESIAQDGPGTVAEQNKKQADAYILDLEKRMADVDLALRSDPPREIKGKDHDGKVISGAELVKLYEDDFQAFLKTPFPIDKGKAVEIADKLSSLRRSVGAVDNKEVSETIGLIERGNNIAEGKTPVGTVPGSVTKETLTPQIKDSNTNRLISNVSSPEVKAQMEKVMAPGGGTKENLTTLLDLISKSGDTLTDEFLAIADRLLEKVHRELGSAAPSPSLSETYKSTKTAGKDTAAAFETLKSGINASKVIPDKSTPVVVKPDPVVVDKPKDPVVVAKPKDPVVVAKPKDPVVVAKPKDPVVVDKPKPILVVDNSGVSDDDYLAERKRIAERLGIPVDDGSRSMMA